MSDSVTLLRCKSDGRIYFPNQVIGGGLHPEFEPVKYVPASELAKREEFWQQVHKNAINGLMLLHDRPDIKDGAGLRVGDYMANAVPWLVAEHDRMMAALAAHEERERLWRELDAERERLDQRGVRYSEDTIYLRELRGKLGLT